MKLTIVTVCYNSENIIERAIKSITSQLSDDVEYLIIDGKSTDNTLDIIKKYDNVNYISEKDSGIYNAMNKGIRRSNGEWILFINSDDFLLDNSLNKLIDIINQNENYDCIYGNIRQIINHNEDNYYKEVKPSNFTKIKKGMIFSHQSFLCKRSVLLDNMFNENYRIASDWDMILNIHERNYKFKYVDFCFSCFSLDGASSKNYSKENHKIRKEHKLYRLIDIYYFLDEFHNLHLKENIYKIFNRSAYKEKLYIKNGFIKEEF